MLRITAGNRRLCDGLSRRDVLRSAERDCSGWASPACSGPRRNATRPKAKSLILFFLEGGPAHQDLWDMKPDAPEGIRGEFKPIATTVPGLQFCEHLPLLAAAAHHLTLVRSVHHTDRRPQCRGVFCLDRPRTRRVR